jgi:hypothetical protein
MIIDESFVNYYKINCNIDGSYDIDLNIRDHNGDIIKALNNYFNSRNQFSNLSYNPITGIPHVNTTPYDSLEVEFNKYFMGSITNDNLLNAYGISIDTNKFIKYIDSRSQ